jgi:Fe-S-cluster containining protein
MPAVNWIRKSPEEDAGMNGSPRKRWWYKGVRFACQGSGKCCVSRGAYGYVYLTLEDRQRLARTLGMATRDFTHRYCTKTNGLFHLKDAGPDCVFLEGSRCSVYEGRPTQCRTWPFWPENMGARAWTAIAAFCPGVGRGRILPRAQIEEILRDQRRSSARL